MSNSYDLLRTAAGNFVVIITFSDGGTHSQKLTPNAFVEVAAMLANPMSTDELVIASIKRGEAA